MAGAASGLMEYVKRAASACRRWDVSLHVPPGLSDEAVAAAVRTALIQAADKAAAFADGPYYPDDNSWSFSGIHGLSLERMKEEMKLATDPMAPSPEEWGIMARVVSGDLSFDVPIALDLDQDAARRIMLRIDGCASDFVDTDFLADVLDGHDFSLQLHAGNWGNLRELAAKGDMPLDLALQLRRPAVWDVLRARLADRPPEPMAPFSEEEFYARYARSCRYDRALMDSNKGLLTSIVRENPKPFSVQWLEWFPAVVDLLNSIGKPQQMDGMSVILNFVVEEPVVDSPGFGWAPVAVHNVVVAYGLHPLSAVHLLDLVKSEPTAFYDLPETADRRFCLMGASVIQDAQLSMLRVSAIGRTDAYDRVASVDIKAVLSA